MRSAVVVRAAGAVALLLALCACTGTARTEKAGAALPDWRPYVAAGKTLALDLVAVDYKTVDSDVQRILDNSTGSFYDDFKMRSEEFVKVVREAQSATTATVDEARLQSHDTDRARVLVVLTATTTNAGKPISTGPRQWRLFVTVQKIADTYKASRVEFLL
jgi:hypothetical protein